MQSDEQPLNLVDETLVRRWPELSPEARRAATLAMSLNERLAFVERITDDYLAARMQSQGIDYEEAVRRMEREHSAGRRPSVANR